MKTFRKMGIYADSLKKSAKLIGVPNLGVLPKAKNAVHTPKRKKRSKTTRDAWARFGYEVE